MTSPTNYTGYNHLGWIILAEAHRRAVEGLNTLGAPASLVYNAVTWKPTYDNPNIINTPVGPRIEQIHFADGAWLAELDMSIPTQYSLPVDLSNLGGAGPSASPAFVSRLGRYLKHVATAAGQGLGP